MAWFQKVLLGVDLDEEQARNNEYDAQLKALNDQSLQNGEWTKAQYDKAEADRKASNNPDITGDVQKTFNDQLDKDVSGFRNAVGSTVAFPLRLIPWQVWAIGAIALFFYMGGGAWLKGRLK
jgi:hypothetical protein